MVSRLVRDQEHAGSTPATPTKVVDEQGRFINVNRAFNRSVCPLLNLS